VASCHTDLPVGRESRRMRVELTRGEGDRSTPGTDQEPVKEPARQRRLRVSIVVARLCSRVPTAAPASASPHTSVVAESPWHRIGGILFSVLNAATTSASKVTSKCTLVVEAASCSTQRRASPVLDVGHHDPDAVLLE
jgi:hypothetical protein